MLRLSGRLVPVFDVREPANRVVIARLLASGRPAAFYMGLFTIMRVVGPPWRDVAGAEMFWTVKRDRPSWSKLPIFVRPSRALRLADFTGVHPEFCDLRIRERFERLWAHQAPLHVVTPLRRPHRFLPSATVTTPDDLVEASNVDRAARDRWLAWSTASMFWMADPAWEDLAVRLEVACRPRSWMVGSSFNDHGSPPPFTLNELTSHCAARHDLPFDLVITDRLLEECGGFSSHSLVRLPMRDEPPALVMLRWGSVSPTWLTQATGYDVRVLDSTTQASRPAGLTDHHLRTAFEDLARRRHRQQPTRSRT
jgi:hypothetical protein